MADFEPKTDAKIRGMGHSMKRKEDPRFIRGKGHYVDDIKLPGMLYMDIVRSPLRAREDQEHRHREGAASCPACWRSSPATTLAKYNLHWMPTLMADTQMVLPIDEVMYQAQEVAR